MQRIILDSEELKLTTARDNLISLFRRHGYQHAPVEIPLCPSLAEHYRKIAGDNTPFEEYFDYKEGFPEKGAPGPNPVEREPVDWTEYYPGGTKEGTSFDVWGVAHEPGSEAAAHMTRMRHPMAHFDSLEQIQSYPFPEFETTTCPHIEESVREIHASGQAVVGGMECTIWETSWYLRDMTQLMMDMFTDDEKAHFLLDKVTESAAGRAAAYARAGVDIIRLGDDIGMQQSIMMSKEMYRTWLKPRLTKVVEAARKEKPDILVFYHTCGYVTPLIEDLIEAGVDILNPVQPECMQFQEIHAEFGDRLSFHGTLGTQTTMPFDTPDDVRKTVFRHLETAGDKGGLFCCPTHLLEPEVPWENIEAYVQACKDFKTAGR
jgi:uroporphyrinogen decarboxylase